MRFPRDSQVRWVRGQRRVYSRTTDLETPRYFVYRLHDETGRILYIGRSCNVVARIKAHAEDPRKQWMTNARRVSMVGPFNWQGAVDAERDEIETHQPVGNIAHTERDPRPAVADRVAWRRQQAASDSA